MFFFKLLFCDEGHVYAKCLFNILTIYPKWHRFHFFSRGTRMYIPMLPGVQNGRRRHLKDSVLLLKNVLLEREESYLYAKCLFNILVGYLS